MKREIQTLVLGSMAGVALLYTSGCVVREDRPRYSGRVYGERVVVYQYQYYPSVEVYFYPQRQTYFWFEAGGWRSGPRVPARFQLVERPVAVELNSDRPYVFHETVRAKHPPGKAKGHDDKDEDKGKGHGKDRD